MVMVPRLDEPLVRPPLVSSRLAVEREASARLQEPTSTDQPGNAADVSTLRRPPSTAWQTATSRCALALQLCFQRRLLTRSLPAQTQVFAATLTDVRHFTTLLRSVAFQQVRLE